MTQDKKKLYTPKFLGISRLKWINLFCILQYFPWYTVSHEMKNNPAWYVTAADW